VTSVGLIVLPDPAETFVYPAHIDRAGIDALPAAPGVYLFLGERDVPVYVGKSVNIRTRVMSHLRTPEEATMLNATRRIDFIRTAGEIGALLLESQLIKQLQPAFNVLLRWTGDIFALRLDNGKLRTVGSCDEDFDDGLRYGLFPSRGTAQQGLEKLVRQHKLCPALTGIEQSTHGRACFAHQIGRCRGACAGKESVQEHHARLLQALEQLEADVWPSAGPIGIVEEGEGMRDVHVIDHWCHLCTLQGRRKTFRHPARRNIDMDVYKILAKPLLSGRLQVIDMSAAAR
jgi:excinuclease Cho